MSVYARALRQLLYVESAGGRTDRALAPPALCERCGCWLSRYREEEETRCSTCRAADSPRLSAEERERRVMLFLAGRGVAVTPDPVFRCPSCGGIKLATSARCARCRYRAPHPKKPQLGDALRGGPCPICGGRKNPKSRLCSACRYADQRLLFAGNPAITCPDCGGPKSRKAVRCRRCRNRHDYGTVYVNGRPAHLVCPECGGPKRFRQAERCRDCARCARGRRLYALASN
jgi:hypothetical protein